MKKLSVEEAKEVIEEIHCGFSRCSKVRHPKSFLQIRNSYDGTEELEAVWYCPECGEYASGGRYKGDGE